MKLTPRETEKLLLSYAGFVAERRKERGLKLNYVEAVAYISSALMEKQNTFLLLLIGEKIMRKRNLTFTI